MSYNVEELLDLRKREDGYTIASYLKRNDPSITEVEIPAEYNGEPVTNIYDFAFYNSQYIKRVVIPPSVRGIRVGAFRDCKRLESAELCEGLEYISSETFWGTALKIVKLPKSLADLGESAFYGCPQLERVEFNSAPTIRWNVFGNCPKLPPETVIMGLVGSVDITHPIPFLDSLFFERAHNKDSLQDYFRPDVFELLAKNNCFRNCDLEPVFYRMADTNNPELFSIAEQYGMLESAELVDKLISYSAERENVEITAYLLELKKRKFGFAGFAEFGGEDNFKLWS